MPNDISPGGFERSAPGFRFSKFDAAVAVLVAVATWVTWPYLDTVSLLFPVVLFHFFLFCNVFRVCRRFELIWSALFLINVTLWASAGRFNWWWILASQLPVTLAVLILEIRSPRYHGIFYRLKKNDQAC